MTAVNAEVMQATGKFHDQVGNAVCGQTEDIFNDAAAFHTCDGMFNDNSGTG